MKDNYILITEMQHLKDGFLPFSRFETGSDEAAALRIFGSLQGNDEKDERLPLQIRLVQSTNGCDKILKIKSCTLDEFTHNCRVITKEVFKITNLD